jgi:hypothetical protein
MPNQSMKPTAPLRNKSTRWLPLARSHHHATNAVHVAASQRDPFSLFATTPSTSSRFPGYAHRECIDFVPCFSVCRNSQFWGPASLPSMSPSSRKVGSQPTLQSGVMLWCDARLRAHALTSSLPLSRRYPTRLSRLPSGCPAAVFAPYCFQRYAVAYLFFVRC